MVNYQTLPTLCPNPVPWIMGHEPGLAGAVSASDSDVCWKVGADTKDLVLRPWTKVLGLVQAVGVILFKNG